MIRLSRRTTLRALGAGMLLSSISNSALGQSAHKPVQGGRTVSERLGSTHADPRYSLTSNNILNEGAKRLQNLGSEVIKVWYQRCDETYPQNSDWPANFESMVERAKHPYFKELFDRPFKTFIINAYRDKPGDYGNHYFRNGMSEAAYESEVDSFYNFTKHLLETYDGTGKEFILQHWQGDWAILGSYDESEVPTQTAIDGMIRWLNARQEGVSRAREEIESDVTVLHAAEVNIVLPAYFEDEPRVINKVVPETEIDLVSHNSYDEMHRGYVSPNPNAKPERSTQAPPEQIELMQSVLEYVNSQTPDPSPYVQRVLQDPEKNVYIGEYGFPELRKGLKSQTVQSKRMTEVALNWGASWVVYWQLYDNEEIGFWLIREDNTRTPTYSFFENLIQSNTVPDSPKFTRIDIDWSHQPDQHAFACSKIEVENSQSGESHLFDIGVPLEEPILWDGCYWVQDGGNESLRWFGGKNSRTTIFLREEKIENIERIRLRGYPKEGGIEATVRVNGAVIDKIGLEERRWDWWETATPTETPTETPKETSESPTVVDTETKTSISTDTVISQNNSQENTEDSASTDGMGIISALSGVAGTTLLYRRLSRE